MRPEKKPNKIQINETRKSFLNQEKLSESKEKKRKQNCSLVFLNWTDLKL